MHSDERCILTVDDLRASYGESQILHGVSFSVRRGEVVTLLGRNGAGKSTTLKSVMGIVTERQGSIRLEDDELIDLRSDRIARKGIAYCPEERGIFSTLDVEENLLLPPAIKAGGMSLQDVYALFPRLLERRKTDGTKLSGGEQQMLAIARLLRVGADLLLLDEPTEGLAPIIVQKIGEVIRALRARGYTILLVEQNFRFAATVTDRLYVMEDGHVVDDLLVSEIDSKAAMLQKHLGI